MADSVPLAVTRLKRRADFVGIAANGRKIVRPGLLLQARATPALQAAQQGQRPVARLGLTVSRKVGNAVERNRVKRRLRALAAALFPDFAVAGYDYVIIGRRSALTRPYDRLLDDLRTALVRVSNGENARTQR